MECVLNAWRRVEWVRYRPKALKTQLLSIPFCSFDYAAKIENSSVGTTELRGTS